MSGLGSLHVVKIYHLFYLCQEVAEINFIPFGVDMRENIQSHQVNLMSQANKHLSLADWAA